MDSGRETRGPFQSPVRRTAPNGSPPGRDLGWVMSPPKPITIVGGGLAGLTLGIGLRQRGVPATGRNAQSIENGWRWFGLKAHARHVSLTADLEMHVAPNGYVGLCRLADDEVNVCGLFRRRAGGSSADFQSPVSRIFNPQAVRSHK